MSATFRRLLPEPGPALDAGEVVAQVGMRERAPGDRPYVGLNMIATLDGRVTIRGRTAPIAGEADHALFHALRRGADAVLVGAHTVRVESYGPMDQLAVVVSRSLELPTDRGLLAAPANRVVIVTPGDGRVGECAASVEYLRCADLGVALRELRARFGVRAVICEGGPRLNATLLPEGLVDDLFLSISPLVAGGEDPLTVMTGAPLEPPLACELDALYEADGYLFARYAVRGDSAAPGDRAPE